MNRLAGLIALVVVVAAVAASGASVAGTPFVFALVLVAGGVLASRFVQACEAVGVEADKAADIRHFAARVIGMTFRVGIGTLVIIWMVISALWMFGVRLGS